MEDVLTCLNKSPLESLNKPTKVPVHGLPIGFHTGYFFPWYSSIDSRMVETGSGGTLIPTGGARILWHGVPLGQVSSEKKNERFKLYMISI